MTSKQRKTILNTIQRDIDMGDSTLVAACMRAGVSVAWYRRWHGRMAEAGLDGLADLPRSGRPPVCLVNQEDADKLRAAYLKSNRGQGVGSMSMSARNLAYRGSCRRSFARRS